MRRHPEYPFDTFRIANANLNMGFGIKSRTVKYRLPLKKNTTNGINGSIIVPLPDVM